jgi:hypothetical protein
MSRFVLCVFVAVVLLSGCRKDVSGSYLTVDNQTIFWLQLVRTPDNRLTGQIVFSFLKPDGQIVQESSSLTGAIDGENITLQGGGFLGTSGGTLSGTFNGSSITLAGAHLPPGTLKRATLADYQFLLKDQTARSQAIISANANTELRRKASGREQAFESNVNQLIGQMQRFESEADIHLGRFPTAIEDYAVITEKINAYVTRERRLVGNPNASNARAQLVNAATQLSFMTNQMHFQTQSLEASLQTNITPLRTELSVYEAGCHNYTPGREYPEPTPEEVRDHRTECGRLLILIPAFQQKYNALASGLSQLEEVYKTEKDKQEKLLARAQRME